MLPEYVKAMQDYDVIEGEYLISVHGLCPGNSARSLSPLLNVALSSARAMKFSFVDLFLTSDGFSMGKWSFFN
jgi:hypothetical protein